MNNRRGGFSAKLTSFYFHETKPNNNPSSLCHVAYHHLAGLVVKASDGIFPGQVTPVTYKMALQWLPCQAPGVIGSALRVVGPVSVYCDWVR